MPTKQAIINMIDTMPQSIITELYHYAYFLTQQLEKESRNAAYVEKIRRGIDQCAEGRGLERDIVEVPEYE